MNSTKGKVTAYNDSEQEVLYKRNMPFKVMDVLKKDGIYNIFMEEM